MKKTTYFNVYYYVPKSHLEITQRAIFDAGAGQTDKYTCCAWVTKGTGQFKAGKSSDPFCGKIGKVNKIIEYKVETICPTPKIKKIIKALKDSHPYESLVYGVIRLEL